MAASYPSSVKTFPTITAGVTEIQAIHPTALQEEVAAIETALLNGTQHHLKANTNNTYDLGTTSVRWRALYLAGVIESSYTGVNNFTGSGAGAVTVRVRNSAAGTGNKGSVEVGNDTSATLGQLEALASNFSTSGPRIAETVALIANGSGGLALAAVHASGVIKWYAGGSTQIGGTAATGHQWNFSSGGVWSRNVSEQTGIELHVRPNAGSLGYVSFTEDSVADRWSVGIHNADSVLYFRTGRPNGSAVAHLTTGGVWRVGAGSQTVPSLSTTGDTNTGLFFPAADQVQLVNGGAFNYLAKTDNSRPLGEIPGGAFGTGAIGGCTFLLGRNSSGGGAPSTLALTDKAGTIYFLWIDTTGDLRIGTAIPEEDGTPADTSGTVVGTQS